LLASNLASSLGFHFHSFYKQQHEGMSCPSLSCFDFGAKHGCFSTLNQNPHIVEVVVHKFATEFSLQLDVDANGSM
jgi:hypothetical protein